MCAVLALLSHADLGRVCFLSLYLACTYVYAQVLRKGGMMYDEQGQQRSGPAIAQKVQEQLQRHPDYWL